MPRKVSDDEVTRVWEAWRVRQRRPDIVRLTDERAKLVRKRLALGYTADEFVALIRFAYEANDKRAAFWRGANPERKTYLDLENLLRESKLGDRIPVVVLWAEAHPEGGSDPGLSAEDASPVPQAGLRPGARTVRALRATRDGSS